MVREVLNPDTRTVPGVRVFRQLRRGRACPQLLLRWHCWDELLLFIAAPRVARTRTVTGKSRSRFFVRCTFFICFTSSLFYIPAFQPNG